MQVKDLCDFCEGELKAKIVDLDLHIGSEWIICKDLPAEVCTQCGEKYFDAEVSSKIDEFLTRHQQEKPIKYIPVPIFSRELVLQG